MRTKISQAFAFCGTCLVCMIYYSSSEVDEKMEAGSVCSDFRNERKYLVGHSRESSGLITELTTAKRAGV